MCSPADRACLVQLADQQRTGRGNGDHEAIDVVLLRDPGHVVSGADHVHAVDPSSSLVRVVVEDRHCPVLRPCAAVHRADQLLGGVARPEDDGWSLILRGLATTVPEGPQNGAGGQHRHEREGERNQGHAQGHGPGFRDGQPDEEDDRRGPHGQAQGEELLVAAKPMPARVDGEREARQNKQDGRDSGDAEDRLGREPAQG